MEARLGKDEEENRKEWVQRKIWTEDSIERYKEKMEIIDEDQETTNDIDEKIKKMEEATQIKRFRKERKQMGQKMNGGMETAKERRKKLGEEEEGGKTEK
ncbi:hypothetical protein FQR65_LT03529 [Abscondita terminalis]|nr:hypothetical protein FQR65_LT03529 [Abscondita terminalis]